MAPSTYNIENTTASNDNDVTTNKRYGWILSDAKAYYVNEDGSMVSKQWLKVDDVFYYFGVDGLEKIDTGAENIYKSEYAIKADETWRDRRGWIKLRADEYYFNGDGFLAMNEWVEIDDVFYYFGSDGIMNLATKNQDDYETFTEQDNIYLQNFAGLTYNTYFHPPNAGSGIHQYDISIEKIEDNKVWGYYMTGYTNPTTIYEGDYFYGIPIKDHTFIITSAWSGGKWTGYDWENFPDAYSKVEITFEKMVDGIPIIQSVQLGAINGSEDILMKHYNSFYDSDDVGKEIEWFPNEFMFNEKGMSEESVIEWIKTNIKNNEWASDK